MTDLIKRPAAHMVKVADELGMPRYDAITVGLLEKYLLGCFPPEYAEPWDRTGLLVGDPDAVITRVAVALDPTVRAISAAAAAGANVLVTHHPAYLDAPDVFRPASSVAKASGAGVWEAISRGVALLNVHTALDVSPQAQAMLPSILGLEQVGILEPVNDEQTRGYGQVCVVPQQGSVTLGQMAATCLARFGRPARIWGSIDTPLRTVVTGLGSCGNLGAPALERGLDCLICGEIKYHQALDLSQAGLCVIELGHDISELPLTIPLAAAVRSAGIPDDDVFTLDQNDNWTTPESTRL